MADRKLARHETHDLGMIIKDRAKVLKSHIAHQAAVCLADFEMQIAAAYQWDQDDVWKAAVVEAQKAMEKAQEIIHERCRVLGIPDEFAPSLTATWGSRGQNGAKERREELRLVAKSRIAAMSKEAEMLVDKEALDLRTQVVAMGLLSAAASEFLTSMKTVEAAMPRLKFVKIEETLDSERVAKQRRFGSYH